MRIRLPAIFLVILVCYASVCSASAGGTFSPAEQRIAAARQVIASNPKSAQAYNDLTAALCRRARETGRVELFDQAERAVDEAARLAPGNYDGQKLRTAILLGQHRYADALELARKLNQKVPDDIPVWGLLVEANIALGNYSDAEKQAQWMLDLRPGNGPAFIRAGELREIFGDADGALEFFEQALRRTPESETEDRAFLLTRMARLHLLSGDSRRASSLLQQALALYPDYHLALRELAAFEASKKNLGEAAALLDRRYRQVQSPESLYDFARMLERAGRKPEAAAAFAKFKTQAVAAAANPNNANRELVFFYADGAGDPARALEIAVREKALRHDVYTHDAYAWALYRNGKFPGAKTELDKALAVGVREPLLFCHAGKIAAALKDSDSVKKYAEASASLGDAECGEPAK